MGSIYENSARTLRDWKYSPIVRIFGIASLALFLQIPITFIGNLVGERAENRQSAISAISNLWGGEQIFSGPFLMIPYLDILNDRVEKKTVTFLASHLQISAKLTAEIRRRGMFEIPVYVSIIGTSGTFEKPNFYQWGISEEHIIWEQAKVRFEISDVRGIGIGTRFLWGGTFRELFSGSGSRQSRSFNIHAKVNPQDGESWGFSSIVELRGSNRLSLAPVAKRTRVQIVGDWPDPKFVGSWPPTERNIHSDGFTASWLVSHLGRGYPQSWIEGSFSKEIDAATVGVELLNSIDPYRQTNRSLRYSILFITLTFGCAWLFEVFGKVRLHLIHYGLIGSAICIFYLLEIALSEHLPFSLAYSIAACVVMLTIGAFVLSLMSVRWAMLIGFVLSFLYAGMYALLLIEDYALIAGSIGLFVILSVIMYSTRKVNWYSGTGKGSGMKEEVLNEQCTI